MSLLLAYMKEQDLNSGLRESGDFHYSICDRQEKIDTLYKENKNIIDMYNNALSYDVSYDYDSDSFDPGYKISDMLEDLEERRLEQQEEEVEMEIRAPF